MVPNEDITRSRRSWPWWRWVLTGLSGLGLVLSAYLSWHYLIGGTVIGCGGGSPCDQVLNSRWSSVGGVLPVSGLAAGAYLAMFGEPYTPTNTGSVPTKNELATFPTGNKRRPSFSVMNATQGSKVDLHQTEHPNALPASWHCPGQHKGAVLRVSFTSTRPVRFRSGMRLSQLCEFELGRRLFSCQTHCAL